MHISHTWHYSPCVHACVPQENRLQGTLPSIEGFTHLHVFNARGNVGLSGTIPADVSKAPLLTHMDLSNTG